MKTLLGFVLGVIVATGASVSAQQGWQAMPPTLTTPEDLRQLQMYQQQQEMMNQENPYNNITVPNRRNPC